MEKVIKFKNSEKITNRIEAPISNSQGEPFVAIYENKYYLGIEDYSGIQLCEISRNLFDMWCKEFHSKQS